MTGRTLLTAMGVVAAVHALGVRPKMLTWGATRDELARTYPADELIRDADGGATMATTLPAPPDIVWPWLVQMGCDRAGWYSWDQLDNGGTASASRIVPELQHLEVGQHLYRVPRGPANWWTVVVLEPERTLVLRSGYELSHPGRAFEGDSGRVPATYVDGIWGFHLRPDPAGGTRLVVRTRSRSHPRPLTLPLSLLLGEPVHFLMQVRQFQNLRRRVETRGFRRDSRPAQPAPVAAE